ncbi:MAG: O-acetyl-ADP-ribose deacetylase [Coriobacteriia bacterium]
MRHALDGGTAMEFRVGDSVIRLVQGDITRQQVDVVVNAANSSLMGGGGVDGAIHRAGGPSILAECKKIVAERGRLPAGDAVITTAGEMPARRVIHTVGPVWRGGRSGEAEVLASAYRSSLDVAESEGLASVAFPSISTGAYGYPVEAAAEVALRAVSERLATCRSVREVYFVLYDDRTYEAYRRAMEEISGEGR